ncbi:MAG: Ig-like domain-containing protein [Rhodocyclaceae bacterium]|nr:Ig-like domain-containing protein [Rhodocyclaceae bacterium]
MFKTIASRLAIASLTAVLAACGGGGGGEDTCIGCPTGGTDGNGVQTGTSLSLIVSSPTLATDGSDRVVLRATVKDSSNAAVPEQVVTFSADSGTITAPSATTDDQGVATVEFNSDDNKANRTVTVRAQHASLAASSTIQVSGTTLSFGGDLAGVIGQPVNMVVSLADSSGVAIANSSISLSSSLGNPVPATVATNAQGQASFTFTPTTAGTGPDTITATALGATAKQALSVSSVNFRFETPLADANVRVKSAGGCEEVRLVLSGFSASSVVITNPRGTVHADSACAVGSASSLEVQLSNGAATAYVAAPSAGTAKLLATASDGVTNASTTVSINFIAVTPSTVSIQGTPTTVGLNGTSNLTALVKDAQGNPVAGKTVTFAAPNGGGTPNPAQAITDEAGRALTVFTADPSISGKDSVIVTASVLGTTVTGQAELTVAGNAVNIVIGTDNTINPIEPVSYRKRFVALVGDTAGNPVTNQTVTVSINFNEFRKGFWEVINPDNVPPWTKNETAVCPAEEANNNGIVDAGELGDRDGDGTFEPNGAAVVRPAEGAAGSTTVTIVTDSFGAGEFWVDYPRSYASWARLTVIATAVVAGQNSVATSNFTLPYPASEVLDATIAPSFEISPFGVVGDCLDPN